MPLGKSACCDQISCTAVRHDEIKVPSCCKIEPESKDNGKYLITA